MLPILALVCGRLRSLAPVGRLKPRGSAERGQTMAEFALLLAVVAFVVVVVAALLGANLSTVLHSTAGKV